MSTQTLCLSRQYTEGRHLGAENFAEKARTAGGPRFEA